VVPLLNAVRPTKGTMTYILQKNYEFRVMNFGKILMFAVAFPLNFMPKEEL
jgi:hypothetical protein